MPMTDFAKWTEENAHYKEVLAGSYGATVAENRQVYDEVSAVHHVGAFESVPVMLIHGDTDPTVPAGHSERLAAKLKERGYPHSLRMVKGVAHVDEIMDGLCDEASAFLIGSHAK
jgi:dipeptidyl aminopeptidase/acylaminoacyl peptidase